MPTPVPVAPSEIVPDPRQPALFDAVPIPPVCTRADFKAADFVLKGFVSRLNKLPPALANLVLNVSFTGDEFHHARLAAGYFYLNTQDLSEPLKAWILSCAAAELEPREDNGPEVPQ